MNTKIREGYFFKVFAWAAVLGSGLSAQAQTVQLNGSQPATGSFVYSSALLSAYGLASASIQAQGGATPILDDASGTYSGKPNAVIGATANLTNVSFNADNTINTVASATGGTTQIFPTGASTIISSGGNLSISGLSVSYDTGASAYRVDADLSGANGVVNETEVPVFQVGSLYYSVNGSSAWTLLTDPSGLVVAPGNTYTLEATNLFLPGTLAKVVGGNVKTAVAASGNVEPYFIQSLALGAYSIDNAIPTLINPPGGAFTPDYATNPNNGGFGTLTSTFSVVAVPEPSTLKSLAVGLLGLAAMSAVHRGACPLTGRAAQGPSLRLARLRM